MDVPVADLAHRQQGLRQPQGFCAVSECHVVIVDGEKGSIFDVRNKLLVRSVKAWTGEVTADGRFGLSATPRKVIIKNSLYSTV